MKRDIEIARAILIEEEDPTGKLPGKWTDEEISYHRALLIEAGYLRGQVHRCGDTVAMHCEGITWAGHEFVSLTSNPSVWQAVRNRLRREGCEAAFTIAADLARDFLRQKLGLP